MKSLRDRGVLEQLRRRHPHYSESAYLFLLAALHRLLERLETPRHVTGEELAHEVRDLAIEKFGPLARTVLEHWGIHSTADLGEIVFLLVDYGVLTKQPNDTKEDFHGLFTFREAFEEQYPWGVLEGRGSA